MTAEPSNFQRLYELFDRLVELPPDQHETEIARLAADAPDLAEELRALLAHAARTRSPLDAAAVRLQAESEPPLPRIPGFRLHRCIGRGGSSTVYLADQEHPEFTRVVALKVVDRLVDDGSLRSVREEQRILARLEHPGIARLYDSGMTPWGQHWLAMEHVEGESILDHCRSHGLTARQRIELFVSVLDAVAYAHARAIIHRDLKPANIFVTANGEPRLLDFGIAKLSNPDDHDETRTLQRALTPAYASPEQMRGDRTTTASDIYSLGVVLYELLTDTLPRPEATRLGGDIGAVLNKALRQRPEERYASATAMAGDLRRILAGEPVAARRGQLWYRTRELARRHRVALAVAMLVPALAAGWQLAGRWREARPGVELAIYHQARPVELETRRLLRDGAAKLARFDGAGARESFRRAAAASKGRLPGEALAWDGLARAESSLGETGRAAEAARRAGALVAAHAGALPDHEAERMRARALAANGDWSAAIGALERLFAAQPERVDIGLDLVRTLLACGRTDAADTALGRLRQLAAGGDPRVDVMEAEVALQLSEFQRAAAAASRGRDGAARAHAVALGQRAARLHAEAISRLDQREQARRELASIIARNLSLGLDAEAAAARLVLASALLRFAGSDEAGRQVEAALAGCRRAGDRRCEILARTLAAMIAGMQGRLSEAIGTASAALADARAIGDRWSEGYVLSQLHVLYNWADDTAAIKAINEPLLAALRDSGNRRLLKITLCNIALVAIDELELEKAQAYIAEADALARRGGSQLDTATVDRTRGTLEEARGDFDLARKSYAAAVAKDRQAGATWNVGNHLDDLAWLEVAAGRPDAAAQHAREAMAAFLEVGDKQMAATTEGVLAWSEAMQGDVAAARRRVAAIRKVLVADDASENDRFTFLDTEAHVAAASGDWHRAIELRRRLARMAAEWSARGLVIKQQVHLARALHGAGERRALEKLVGELLPEVERHELRGIARELRALVAPKR